MSTPAVTDYNDITEALVALIAANVADFDKVSEEELDLNGPLTLNHRRQCDVQLIEADDTVTAGANYRTSLRYHLVIAAYDLSSYRDAARIRNDLVRSTKLVLRQNPRFAGDVLATITGRTGFAEDTPERGFIALAVVEIMVQAYEGDF